jgi:hypothetical protein
MAKDDIDDVSRLGNGHGRNLLPHHEAWLSAHPHRTAEWLLERTRDGFDIHHGDGDHSNNDPDNLFMVEHRDHLRLHGQPLMDRLRRANDARRDAARRERIEAGRCCYHLKRMGYLWPEVARALGRPEGSIMKDAKAFAEDAGLLWPLPRPEGCATRTKRQRLRDIPDPDIMEARAA